MIAVAIVIAVLAIANLPVTTRQGVGYVQSAYTLPLYVKALEFVQRDASYRYLARRIIGERRSAEERVLTLFDWTTQNIRDNPPELPIVDDHVWHIIVRGYGVDDQKADVFTTLATYAGVPAFFTQTTDKTGELTLSYAWVNRRWTVFDAENRIVFRNRAGQLASADELARSPQLVASIASGRTHRGRPYAVYFEGYRPPPAPDILRGELQMLWPRVFYRLRQAVGVRREWHTS